MKAVCENMDSRAYEIGHRCYLVDIRPDYVMRVSALMICPGEFFIQPAGRLIKVWKGLNADQIINSGDSGWGSHEVYATEEDQRAAALSVAKEMGVRGRWNPRLKTFDIDG